MLLPSGPIIWANWVAYLLNANYNRIASRQNTRFGGTIVANVKDDHPNVDEPDNIPGEIEPEAEISPEALETLTEVPEGIEPIAVEQPVGEEEPKAEEQPAVEEKPKEEEEYWEEPSKLPLYLEIVLLVGIPLILAGLVLSSLLDWAIAVYVICAGLVPYMLWKSRKTNTIFTILLGCTLVAILTAILFLWVEISKGYKGDINAREAKDRKYTISQPIEPNRSKTVSYDLNSYI
jgi:hypothetical protein